jgi:hypothetical protein
MGQLDAAFRDLIRGEIEPLRQQVSVLLTEIRSRVVDRRPPARTSSPLVTVDDEPLDRKGAAQMMGCCVRTVGRRIKSGELRALGPRQDRISRFEVQRYLDNAGKAGVVDLREEAARLLKKK